MTTIVQKFGGSSVADLDKLRAVADHVVATRDAGHAVVVVVSAMGKTTENLLALARRAASPPGTDGEGEPARRELDMLVSTGERVSMALLSIAIRARGRESISFTGSQSGIITTNRHFDARIIEVRPQRVEEELGKGRIVIVAGYQGMSQEREITTLGRGGSDTTAVALAAALDAAECQIMSDVDGVYTADPRNVPDARHLPEVDYESLQEMAESGAKVLNAQAVEWARAHDVVIHARKTGDTDGPGGGPARETLVRASGARTRTIVVQKNLALVRARAAAATPLLQVASECGLPLRDLSIAGKDVIACAPLTNVPDWPSIRRSIEAAQIDGLVIGDGLASVSVVGVEVGTSARNVHLALDSLPGLPIWMTTSPLRISCLTLPDAADAAEGAWHELFVTTPAASTTP